VLREQAQPLYIEGYHRPDYLSPDDAVYDAITDLMSSGRTCASIARWCAISKSLPTPPDFPECPHQVSHLFAFYAFPLLGTIRRRWPTPFMPKSSG